MTGTLHAAAPTAAKMQLLWDEFFAVHALLQPEGAAIAELHAAGIAPERILSLYPLTMAELPHLLHAHLRTDQQVWRFTSELEKASEQGLTLALLDRMRAENYDALSEQGKDLYAKYKNYNALSDAYKRVEPSSAKRWQAYSLVSSAFLTAADFLWLGANWGRLPELRGCELAYCDRLSALRELLDTSPPDR